MPKCTLLVGLPGVGKSTWLDGQLFETGRLDCILSTDDIIQDIADEYLTTYNAIFSNAIKLAEQIMWYRAEAYVDMNCDVIVDRTNLSVKSRKRFIDFFKSAGYEIEAIAFKTPVDDEHERRLVSRAGKSIPAHVIASMRESYVFPSPAEGIDCIKVIGTDGMWA